MNQFKKVLLSAFATVAIFGTTLVSCTSDPCDPKTVTCLNAGTCLDGTCTCPSGFLGKTCDTKANAKFVGSWSAKEKLGSAPAWAAPYTVVVTADGTAPKTFYFQNYGNYSCTAGNYQVTANSTDGTSYLIASTACSTTFTGTGTLSTTGTTSTIDGSYTATYGSPTTTDNVVIQMTK